MNIFALLPKLFPALKALFERFTAWRAASKKSAGPVHPETPAAATDPLDRFLFDAEAWTAAADEFLSNIDAYLMGKYHWSSEKTAKGASNLVVFAQKNGVYQAARVLYTQDSVSSRYKLLDVRQSSPDEYANVHYIENGQKKMVAVNTMCNQAASLWAIHAINDDLDYDYIPSPDGATKAREAHFDANRVHDNLASKHYDTPANKIIPVERDLAVKIAAKHGFVFVTWRNKSGTGHIAVVEPSSTDFDIKVIQAGAQTGREIAIADAFGKSRLAELHYWAITQEVFE